MQPHDDQPIDEILTRSCGRDTQFLFWLDGLQDTDPTFAQASVLHADDWREWQATLYLLSGCEQIWAALGPRVRADRSISPAVHGLERGRRPRSSSEHAVRRWVAHVWNDRNNSEVGLQSAFEEFYFLRWITACHLYKRIAPDADAGIGGAR